ncbi:unnamed protein product [Penicillium egyptiacum]|uniref:Rhodopsin domain-containing protein n=1 Tax=Penicillium egyptiacum TaxID=1303716 RepID=A0A9W4KD55_9EURO|nr:unnamed protein product [Penicillium egyptiacum]
MSLSPLGEAPVGTDLSADHGSLEIGPVIATYVLAVITVGLRFYTRLRVQGQRIAADDWMIVGALLAVTACFALIVIAVELMRVLFAFVVLYVLTVPLIKLSVLLFYRRIFGMTYPIWFCVFLTIGYFLSGTIAFLACCRPVSYFWTQFEERSGGKCVFNLYPFYISHAAINVATDGIILLVPIPIVWKLQMRWTQKLMLSGIFLVGGFVLIASLIRIYYITFLRTSADYTWVMGKFFVWSSVEPCIGILCACLPTLHPLLRLVIARMFGTSTGRYGGVPKKKQEVANKRTFIRRPRPLDWDETLLTTHDIQVEMSGVRRDHAEDGQITVDMEFRIVEESNQLK